MNKNLNLLCIFIVLAFAIVCNVAIHAQETFRLSRSDSNINSSAYPPLAPSRQTIINDNSSAFRINLPPASQSTQSLKGGVQAQQNSLTQVQLQRLAAHDIVLLIDKSGSMATADCPISSGGKSILSSLLFGSLFSNSRWQWCQSQTAQMSELTRQVIPEGFTILLFDSGYYLFPHASTSNLGQIFARNSPGGSTNLTAPLNAVFTDYFKRKQLSQGRIKPLLIGIITDGCPDQPKEVRRQLVDLTHSLQNQEEITIVFFLIGSHDSKGEKFVANLSNNLVADGAAFNIVKCVPFSDVQNSGLARSLADNLD